MRHGFGPRWESAFKLSSHLRRKHEEHITGEVQITLAGIAAVSAANEQTVTLLVYVLSEYGKKFIQHLCEPENESETYLDGVPKEGTWNFCTDFLYFLPFGIFFELRLCCAKRRLSGWWRSVRYFGNTHFQMQCMQLNTLTDTHSRTTAQHTHTPHT